MKQISVREVQHHLARVLSLVEEGEEIEITRRDIVVARLLPATGRRGIVRVAQRPDFDARLRSLYPDGPLQGGPAADEVRRGRHTEE